MTKDSIPTPHGLTRRTLLRTAPVAGVAGLGLAGLGASQAHAAEFANDFTQAVHYDKGRHFRDGRATTVKGIVIHWWGNPSGQSHQQVVNFLAGANVRVSSAHYVVSSSRTSQIVKLSDTAYHAGVYAINAESVGIECRPEMDSATVKRVKTLIRQLQGKYGPLWLAPHRTFTGTTCPGSYMSLIPEFKVLAAGSSSNIPEPPGGDTTSPDQPLDVDGFWGNATTTKLQQVMGTPADGVVSSQAISWKLSNPGLVGGWEWVADASATGSTVIRAVQGRIGATVDGLIGPNTIKALQKHYGTTQDGVLSEGSVTIKAMQQALNSGSF